MLVTVVKGVADVPFVAKRAERVSFSLWNKRFVPVRIARW